MSVHFGISSQSFMAQLSDIFDECSKIADLKKKIEVDLWNTRKYEQQIWKTHERISALYESY
jgi:hypothetical protein